MIEEETIASLEQEKVDPIERDEKNERRLKKY